ncbi:uncharacterized protein LACBIDRAFT_295733 [Laccaria bicolor S238N-H82]|uniref:Predicted protein n=1 Tax=Laccaria bicolor (strain S238N-H82 / ATCC MYA-4686) TaxID=486041 RepID=B0DXM4_LACBS|nr:uncharacterized protein LACBIDRAFT_295733 [Laccaria bicolor S238N-H82]EDR00705.1 predicted protein [Laccaria bicolor S238N-H82]|eukprot:XP_001888714.1 predicted protein [Laccaria bicolor S238N-H82]
MSAIGPELPPHLQSQTTSHPDKDNNEGFLVGPQVLTHPLDPPATSNGPSVTIGPIIPPQFLKDSANREEEEEEDDYMPELPPDLVQSRIAGPSAPGPSRRQVGPSLPSYAPTYDPRSYADKEEDDDDDFGPKPLPAGMQHRQTDAVKEFMEKEEKRRKHLEELSKPKELQRDEWMLVPPSSSDLLGKLDPTKLKGRQFSRSTAPASGKPDNSLWTETPAERQQRLADEVSGKKRRAVETQPVDDDPDGLKKRRRRDEELIRKGVEDHTQKMRGPSLIQQHSAGKTVEEKKDSGIWDHSRDMGLGGRLMDDDKRNKLIRESRGLGDRFGSGKSGGFL